MSSTSLASSSGNQESYDERRATLQDRLGSLFNSSPRSSTERSRPVTPLPAETRGPASKPGLLTSAREGPKNSTRAQNPSNMPLKAASLIPNLPSASQNWSLPITRWFMGSNPVSENGVTAPAAAALSETSGKPLHRRFPSDSFATRDTNQSGTVQGRRSEDIPSIARNGEGDASIELQQAISDEVFKIRRPPEARMPSHCHHHNERQLQRTPSINSKPSRHPVLLDNLSRASMPTSSLSRPLAFSSSLSVQPNLATSPISYLRSPSIEENRSPTSIDSLRSLTARDRGIQTSTTSMSPATRWWFQDENKSAVDEILKEEDQASTAQEEAEAIRKKYLTPRLPLVFCHGLLGFDSVSLGASFAPLQITHWRGIKEVLEENGIEILITRVPATSGIEERAKVLEAKIEEVYPGREIHLIGHSMGGLDCRYLTSVLRPTKFKIRSVTTIASPHRGSAFANYFLETLGKTRIPALVSFLEYLPNGGGDGKAFEMLTVERMKEFNELVKDVDGVKYFSWGASYMPGLVDAFKWPHSVILDKEGPNDGMVSVSSAKWGKYLGTLEGVNHLDLVGWVNTARYKWAELTGKSIKFKPASFYLEIASKLAEEVEGLSRDDTSQVQKEVVFSASDDEETSRSGDNGQQTRLNDATRLPGITGGGVD